MARTSKLSPAPPIAGDPSTEPPAAVEYWRRALTNTGSPPLFVYFIQSGDSGPVKIGQARNPLTRIAELQCGNPETLHLRAIVLATNTLERELHYAWKNHAVRGEWFADGVQEALVELARATQQDQINDHEAGNAPHWITGLASAFLNPRHLQPPSGWRITR